MKAPNPNSEPHLPLAASEESLVGTQSRTATFRPEENDLRMELPRPKSVGRYEIQELLGRGAFGAVYLGWDPQLKRQVAIKAPRLAAENTDEQIESLLEEARRAVQLERRQGIVPVYDVGREQDLCYIVSQYIEGGTLTQFLKAGQPSVVATVRLVATLADIVHFAHCQGWVHRDIKPSNILLDREGNPYLADFGLTSRLDDMRSADGPAHGTPNYMAPELVREALAQARQQQAPTTLRADQRSDVYSLGVVLYQMLSGRLPFDADDLPALFDQVLHADPAPVRLANTNVPARLEEVCFKALAKNPADRYRTAADLRDELRIVAAALSGGETKVKVDDRAVWGLTPGRLAAVVGAALLLCGLIAALFVAANLNWGKPTEHTSPGGETNVALLDKAAPSLPARPLAEPEPVAAPKAMGGVSAKLGGTDRAEVLRELRVMLREERESIKDVADSKLPGPALVRAVDALPAVPPQQADENLNLPAAYFALQTQLNAARKKQDTAQEFSLLLKLTNELNEAGHARQAEQAARRMAELAAQDDVNRPIAYGQLGLAQARLGRFEDAIASQEQALLTYREFEDKLKASDKPQAKAGLAHVSKLLGLTLNRIGLANKELKRYDAADKAFVEANGVLAPFAERRPELTTVLMNHGALLSVWQKHVEAQDTLGEALSLARDLKDPLSEAEVLVNLGAAQSRAGNETQAVESFAQADKLLPATASYNTRSRLLYNWITSLLALEKNDEALVQVDRLREIARPDDPLAQRILRLAEPLKVPLK